MKGNIESQLAEDYYNNVGVGLMRNETDLGFELKAGVPLVTKDGDKLSNAVVYEVNKGEYRTVVTVLSDFGNLLRFPSVEDLLQCYNISEGYLEYYRWSKELDIEASALDTQFCLRDRLERQIELLTKALEGLNNGIV